MSQHATEDMVGWRSDCNLKVSLHATNGREHLFKSLTSRQRKIHELDLNDVAIDLCSRNIPVIVRHRFPPNKVPNGRVTQSCHKFQLGIMHFHDGLEFPCPHPRNTTITPKSVTHARVAKSWCV